MSIFDIEEYLLKSICRDLDRDEESGGGSLGWRYMASQFPACVQPSDIESFKKANSPSLALLRHLSQQMELETVIKVCNQNGMHTFSYKLENAHRTTVQKALDYKKQTNKHSKKIDTAQSVSFNLVGAIPPQSVSSHLSAKPQVPSLSSKSGSNQAEATSDFTQNSTHISTSISTSSPSQPLMWDPSAEGILVIVPYESLRRETRDFSERSYGEGGYKIGRGGFGDVFHVKLRHPTKGKMICAAKRMQKLASDEEAMLEFERELESMKRYRHPCLLPVYGISKDGPNFCILTPFMENGSLKTVIDKKLMMDVNRRISILCDITAALEYLHKHNVVHRDVKSDNVLLDRDFRGKMADFGIVRVIAADKTRTSTGRPIGSEGYMSPEAKSGTITPSGDVYALGVIIAEMLSNKLVYKLGNLSAMSEVELENLADVTIEWSIEQVTSLVGMVMECMRQNPSKRPKSSEIMKKLQNLL